MNCAPQFVYEGAPIGDSANVSYAIARTIDPKCSVQYTACEDIALYRVSCEARPEPCVPTRSYSGPSCHALIQEERLLRDLSLWCFVLSVFRCPGRGTDGHTAPPTAAPTAAAPTTATEALWRGGARPGTVLHGARSHGVIPT